MLKTYKHDYVSFKCAEFYFFLNDECIVVLNVDFGNICSLTMIYMICSSWLCLVGSSWEEETLYSKHPTPFSPESCLCTGPMAQLLQRNKKLEWKQSVHSEFNDAHFARALAFSVRWLVHRTLMKCSMFLLMIWLECICWLLYICYRDPGGATRYKVAKCLFFFEPLRISA